MKRPYALPPRLSPALARVSDYWKRLRRGSAEIPFWDDFNFSDLPGLLDRLFLIDVFEKPERYRLSTVGAALDNDGLLGKFIDDHPDLDWPFEYLLSQCAATVEAAGPTYLRQGPGATTSGYARLVLPMWGDGRIGMLFGLVDPD